MMKSLKKGLMAGIAVAVSSSLLYAAPGDKPKPDPAELTGGKDGNTAAAKPLTADEISKKSTQLQEQMSKDMVHVGRLQQKARKEKDVIKLNCVNDKMVQMKAMMNLADDKRTQITDALTLGNGRAPERFADYSQSANEIKKLREDADVCVGVGPDYVGDSKLNVSNPGIPDDPTAGNPFTGGIEPPAYASPFS
jgi:hypothetical protein